MGTVERSLGIDIGSVSVKLVLMEEGRVARTAYRRFRGGPFETLRELILDQFSELDGATFPLGLTGIGGKTAHSILGGKFFGEIAALARGNFAIVPAVRTVIEMGGEDSKLLILDGATRSVVDFAMNAQCAAGTGSFLDQQAARLRISIEDEFGRLALKSKNPPRIAGRCSVFAKSDMIHLQQIATPDYDIVAGLCYAVARNFKGAIARGKKFERPVAFEGGVAANPGMRRAFTDLLQLEPDELIIPQHYNVVSALGAALLAAEEDVMVHGFAPDRIDAYVKYRTADESPRGALAFDFPDSKFYNVTMSPCPERISDLEVYLGIDVGSLSTNVVLIDEYHRVIARRYLMTEGRPIEAVRRGIEEIGNEVAGRVIVKAVGTTGSGRYLIGDFVGADVVRNEITAQATAALAIDPEVDTIFEIGGQDSKYISIDNRTVVDFEMNKACAAGTGSFLEEQAEKLNVRIETEFGDKALGARCPVGCGERCTVFMESDLVAHQRMGANKDDLLAGLAYSIANNYLTKVVGDRRIGDHIFFQGGVAWNKAVVAAFEKLLGRRFTVPPHHDVTGAIGAAILAAEELQRRNFRTSFKGFDLHKRRYELERFVCDDCPNQCEIHRVAIEGEEPLQYGARCEKYDIQRRTEGTLPPDYVRLRLRLLFRRYFRRARAKKARGRVGIPMVLHFFDHFPFWRAFFEAADFQVVTSDPSGKTLVDEALELFVAETCFPIKLVYGHVANLMRKEVDLIFLPGLIKVADQVHEDDEAAYICPYVQSIGSTIRATFDFAAAGIRFVNPPLSLCSNVSELKHKLRPLAGELGLSHREFARSLDAGLRAYRAYRRQLLDEGQKILEGIGEAEKALVVVSRPYNGCDRRLSLDLPSKIRQLGLKAIPMDFLPVGNGNAEFPYMYWRYGRRILMAGDFVRRHPNLFAVYITPFGCGPDSFITHFFRKRMSGKPYLQLELDEHSADAGMITRCEAFVDSLRFYQFSQPTSSFAIGGSDLKLHERTIYIPNMCDHAYVLSSVFRRFGLNAMVLDEPDELTLEFGKKFTSGKECYPCVITTGDMIKMVRSPGFDRSRSVFFMPGADGPCRFGLYSQYHRLVLDDLGFHDVPIFSPNSNNGYSDFGIKGTMFRRLTWQGLVLVDCLTKLLHLVRPYEADQGQTEKVYLHTLRRVCQAVTNDEPLESLSGEIAAEFNRISTDGWQRPLIGMVGEIFLRHNRFSNNHLIEKLERLGLEVHLAPFCEWPMYTSLDYRRDALRDRDLKAILKGTLQVLMQRRHERRIVKALQRHIRLRHDYPVGGTIRLAGRYLPCDFKGEAILSIGKAIEMIQEGAVGIVNAMPFNCMPGTVVSSLSKRVSEDMGGVPWLNLSYEGLRDSGEDTRLEAFTEQVRAYASRAQGSLRATRA